MPNSVEKTFIGFLFSLKNILSTLILNFVVGAYFYALVYDFKSFYISNVWIVAISIFMGIVWGAFYFLSYGTWKSKLIKDKLKNRRAEKTNPS